MTDHSRLPVTVHTFNIQRGTVEIDTGQPWVERAYSGVYTVTLTGPRPWGEVNVTATAGGPDAEAVAGWQALWRLMLAQPGVTGETWERQNGNWRLVEASGESGGADDGTGGRTDRENHEHRQPAS